MHPGKMPDFYDSFMELDQGRIATRAGGQLYMAVIAQLDDLNGGIAVRHNHAV